MRRQRRRTVQRQELIRTKNLQHMINSIKSRCALGFGFGQERNELHIAGFKNLDTGSPEFRQRL